MDEKIKNKIENIVEQIEDLRENLDYVPENYNLIDALNAASNAFYRLEIQEEKKRNEEFYNRILK